MDRRFARVSLFVLFFATVLRAVDAAYAAYRALGAAVPVDALRDYDTLLAWWRHGDSLRGFTLAPSPHFVDLVLQLPLALAAPDFERFSYALAIVLGALIAVSLLAAVRCAVDDLLASFVAGLGIVVFYALAPPSLVVHLFTSDQTSELFTTLGVLALVYGLFRPGRRHRRPRWAAPVYAGVVTLCVVSSPFFIATYCVPATLALAALLGTDHVSRGRVAAFAALNALGAVAGVLALAVLSRHVWPIRAGAHLQSPGDSLQALAAAVQSDAGVARLAWPTLIGALASGGLVVLARRRYWPAAAIFLLALFPAVLASCLLLPLGSTGSGAAAVLCDLELPWLLGATFFAGIVVYLVHAIGSRVLEGRDVSTVTRWLPWPGLLAAIALVATMHGPLAIDSPRSTTAATLACFRDAESRAGLEDGLAAHVMARYLDAARLGRDWGSHFEVVEVVPGVPQAVDPVHDDVEWFDGTYRGGKARLNFLVTHAFSDEALRAWRGLLGAPDRTITCPAPADARVDGKPTFEIWVWDHPDGQRRLAELVTHDNRRGAFSPIVGATQLAIDPTWGMSAAPPVALVDGRRVWHRSGKENASILVHPMMLPAGHYRVELDLAMVAIAGQTERVAEVVVETPARRLGVFPIAAGTTHFAFELDVDRASGPTSGDPVAMRIETRAAESIEVAGMTVTQLDARGIDPLWLFR